VQPFNSSRRPPSAPSTSAPSRAPLFPSATPRG
jgi:hypothetical protein